MKNENRAGRPVAELFQAEKSGYEKLVRLLEEEWECLKRRDVTGLITLTRRKEGQLEQVQAIRQKIRGWLEAEGRDPRSPEATLGGGDVRRARELQQASGRLKKEIASLNDRNKRYIEESLRIVEQFFSLLARPEEGSPAYVRYENGRGTSAVRSFINKRM